MRVGSSGTPTTSNLPAVGRETEAQLIAAAQQGDRQALDALLREHYDRIWAVCRRIAGNDADAADATQEALMAIVRGIPKFDGRARFSTWAYRVATNACLDELRRRKRRPSPEIIDEHENWAERQGADPSPAFDDQLVARDELETALSQLPEEFRVAVVLRDQVGMDYADIAATLDIPAGTVRSRIARGRSRLSELLTSGNQQDPSVRPTNQP